MTTILALILIGIFIIGKAFVWLINPRYKTGETYRQLEAETSRAWGPVRNQIGQFVFFLVVALPILAVVGWILENVP